MRFEKRFVNITAAMAIVLGAGMGSVAWAQYDTTSQAERSQDAAAASAQDQATVTTQDQATTPPAQGATDQPMGDAWITTKVKSDLLATPDVSGLAIDVDTKSGVVMLKGSVDSKAQADKAVAIAKKIDGVKKVDSSGLTVKKSSGY